MLANLFSMDVITKRYYDGVKGKLSAGVIEKLENCAKARVGYLLGIGVLLEFYTTRQYI